MPNNQFIKATRVAAAALGLLQREIVLPALVWRDAGGNFAGAGGDTISIRVPARTQSRSRPLRGTRTSNGVIDMDELTEHKVDVTLDEDLYNAVPVTDEELTLDITNFGQQVLAPQVRAVAEGVENKLAGEMIGAEYATTLDLDTTEPYNTLVDARVALNKANVPMNERYVVCGADLEGSFLKSEHLSRVDQSGTDSALRDAVIGRIVGFGNIYVSNALPPDVGFAFHRTAYVLSMQAPAIPDGASYGASQTYQSLAMRWLRDYDFRNVQDRSLLDVFAGTNIVDDGDRTNEVQTVTITGGPTGGTFTLSFGGQTTAPIAHDALASDVAAALVALSTVGNNVTVTGAAGGPYTVTFVRSLGGMDVDQLVASASFTGGTAPAIAVATTTAGGTASFVRAVKLQLA